MSWLDDTLWGESLQRWALALALALGAWLLLLAVTRLFSRRMSRLAARSENKFDDALVDMLSTTRVFLLFLIGVWLGAETLALTPRARTVVTSVGTLAAFLQVGLWGHFLVGRYVDGYRARHIDNDGADVTAMGAVGFLGRMLLWSVLLLVALDNLGFDVTALVAGLGIGGVAVALALQNVLGDLFASLSIVIDKPFVVGDFLVIDDLSGTVERVGLKTTRLRSLSGEQLVFGNGDLLSSRIRNYKRMEERRVLFRVGVVYDTPVDLLERIPAMLERAVGVAERARFDRAHFAAHGDFALQFEVVYYVLSREYGDYMDTHQTIAFAIHRRFADEGVQFAYPTQRLLVEGSNPDATDTNAAAAA